MLDNMPREELFPVQNVTVTFCTRQHHWCLTVTHPTSDLIYYLMQSLLPSNHKKPHSLFSHLLLINITCWMSLYNSCIRTSRLMSVHTKREGICILQKYAVPTRVICWHLVICNCIYQICCLCSYKHFGADEAIKKPFAFSGSIP